MDSEATMSAISLLTMPNALANLLADVDGAVSEGLVAALLEAAFAEFKVRLRLAGSIYIRLLPPTKENRDKRFKR